MRSQFIYCENRTLPDGAEGGIEGKLKRAAKKNKETRGGARTGAGRTPLPKDLKKKASQVYLNDADKAKLVAKYGSLTKALRTLF